MADMPTIADLEARLASALGRIGQGLDRLPAAGMAPSDASALHEALDAEKTVAAQLAERLRVVKDREAAAQTAFEAQIAALTEARDQQAQELQRLQQTVAELRQAQASTATAQPHPDHDHLLAELETLRAERQSESAEMEAILSALAPLIEEKANHA